MSEKQAFWLFIVCSIGGILVLAGLPLLIVAIWLPSWQWAATAGVVMIVGLIVMRSTVP